MGRTRTATDLGLDLDRLAAPRSVSPVAIMTGVRPWSMIEHARAAEQWEPCGVCGNALPRGWYCAACDDFFLDPVALPGEPIDSRLNIGWEKTTAHRPDATLRGGKGAVRRSAAR